MKAKIAKFLMLAAAGAAPAIEPPVDSQPVPPRAPARGTPEAPAAPVAPVAPEVEAPRARPVPMPEVAEARPYFGVILDPVPEILSQHLKLAEGEGLVISDLVSGGPADEAGLEADDLLTRVDGVVVGTPEDVRAQVDKHAVGDTVPVEIIQDGERRQVDIVLGAAPIPGAPGIAMQGGVDLDQLLQQFPDKHADLLREAFQRNLEQFEKLEEQAGLPKEFLQRIPRRLGEGGNFEFDFNAESTIRLMDDQGSIEMRSSDGHKEAKVFDKEGNLLWEGPYDTDADKAAVPDDIRERIEKLNVDLDFKGHGLRLQLGPERFRRLDELEPPAPAPELDE